MGAETRKGEGQGWGLKPGRGKVRDGAETLKGEGQGWGLKTNYQITSIIKRGIMTQKWYPAECECFMVDQ
jgi:hypothetical protein